MQRQSCSDSGWLESRDNGSLPDHERPVCELCASLTEFAHEKESHLHCKHRKQGSLVLDCVAGMKTRQHDRNCPVGHSLESLAFLQPSSCMHNASEACTMNASYLSTHALLGHGVESSHAQRHLARGRGAEGEDIWCLHEPCIRYYPGRR